MAWACKLLAVGSDRRVEAERVRRIEIHGARGTAVWETTGWSLGAGSGPCRGAVARRLAAAERGGPWRLLFGTAHSKQIADVVDRVRRRLPPSVTGEDGRHATAVVRAMSESSETGRTALVR